jgi:hypothetical protein
MREWREKSDRSENICSDSIYRCIHYCDEPLILSIHNNEVILRLQD